MEFLLRALGASSSVPVGIGQLARIARPTRARCLKRARLQFRVFYMYCAREVRGLLTKLRGLYLQARAHVNVYPPLPPNVYLLGFRVSTPLPLSRGDSVLYRPSISFE